MPNEKGPRNPSDKEMDEIKSLVKTVCDGKSDNKGDEDPRLKLDLSGMPTESDRQYPLELDSSDPGDLDNSTDLDNHLSPDPDCGDEVIVLTGPPFTQDNDLDNDDNGPVDCDDSDCSGVFMSYPEIADNVQTRINDCTGWRPKRSPLQNGERCPTSLFRSVEPKSPADEKEPDCRPDCFPLPEGGGCPVADTTHQCLEEGPDDDDKEK